MISIGAYESTKQQSVHSLLASFDRSLEHLRRDDTLADPQQSSILHIDNLISSRPGGRLSLYCSGHVVIAS